MSVETDPLFGSDLAGYRLESVLGRGGMGVVYLAQDLRLKRRVALKLVAPELAIDARFRERFLREAELAASLDHSHVVPVYGAGETDGQLWLAMRYVEGEDLGTLLAREGPLEPAHALDLLGQVGEALDAAHEHGLVHRDVKPANVLVTREGGAEHCYLADFGLARSPGDLQATSPTHLSGTVDYTAPEQIAAEAADGRADVYSLGCVLYECLAGRPPFRRDRPASTLYAHLEEPPPSLHGHRTNLPEAIDEVITRALAKSPRDRYETCAQLCEDARDALGLEAPRFSRRTLLLAGGGAAIAIAAAAAVPATLLTRRGHRSAPKSVLPLAGDSVVRIDPVTATPAAAIPVSSAKGTLVYGEGSVWLAEPERRLVSRIDPRTSQIVEEIEIPEKSDAALIAAGEGALWLDYNVLLGGGLWKYDLREHRFALIDAGDVSVEGFTTTPGAVWTVCHTFLRFDAKTGALEATIEPEGQGKLITATDDSVWFAGSRNPVIVSGRSGRIWRGDIATNDLIETIDLDVVIVDMAAGEEAVWAVGLEDDLVRRIDPATNAVSEEFRVGRIPKALGVGVEAVWVTSSRDGTVTRFDTATSNIKTIDVGGAANEIALSDDAVWVAVTV